MSEQKRGETKSEGKPTSGKRTLPRREFLRWLALGAGAGAGALLSSCVPPLSPEEPRKQTGENLLSEAEAVFEPFYEQAKEAVSELKGKLGELGIALLPTPYQKIEQDVIAFEAAQQLATGSAYPPETKASLQETTERWNGKRRKETLAWAREQPAVRVEVIEEGLKPEQIPYNQACGEIVAEVGRKVLNPVARVLFPTVVVDPKEWGSGSSEKGRTHQRISLRANVAPGNLGAEIGRTAAHEISHQMYLSHFSLSSIDWSVLKKLLAIEGDWEKYSWVSTFLTDCISPQELIKPEVVTLFSGFQQQFLQASERFQDYTRVPLFESLPKDWQDFFKQLANGLVNNFGSLPQPLKESVFGTQGGVVAFESFIAENPFPGLESQLPEISEYAGKFAKHYQDNGLIYQDSLFAQFLNLYLGVLADEFCATAISEEIIGSAEWGEWGLIKTDRQPCVALFSWVAGQVADDFSWEKMQTVLMGESAKAEMAFIDETENQGN